jgi:predicted ATP-dependent endonuclease of OLD family
LKEQQGVLSLELKNGKSIPISAAASSVKELVPMLLLLKKFGDKLHEFSVLFEEPEAHLHTTKQVQVADLLAKCMARGTRFIVTTHSDYFLGRINQLIRLGNSKAQSEDAFKAFCAKKGWKENLVLQKEKISAYYFSEDNEGGASVKLLDITDGVPFDTFTSSVDEQFEIDGAIDDLKEELMNDSKEDSCDD